MSRAIKGLFKRAVVDFDFAGSQLKIYDGIVAKRVMKLTADGEVGSISVQHQYNGAWREVLCATADGQMLVNTECWNSMNYTPRVEINTIVNRYFRRTQLTQRSEIWLRKRVDHGVQTEYSRRNGGSFGQTLETRYGTL